MKTNRSLYAALAVALVVALTILFAPVSDEVKFAGIVGYGVVMALLTVGVIEYGRGSYRRQLR